MKGFASYSSFLLVCIIQAVLPDVFGQGENDSLKTKAITDSLKRIEPITKPLESSRPLTRKEIMRKYQEARCRYKFETASVMIHCPANLEGTRPPFSEDHFQPVYDYININPELKPYRQPKSQ